MAVVLNKTDAVKVSGKRKADKPTFYNAQTGTEEPISLDFESFLILAPQDLKDSTVDWIEKSQQPAAARSADRDALLKEAITAELEDSTAWLEEMDKKIEDFREFRDRFQVGQFADVPEIGLMLRDLQTGLDEVMHHRGRAKHLVVMSTVIQGRLETDGVTEAQAKETASWRGPFLAY